MDRIGVFCSASEVIDSIYFDKAQEFGRWMGQNKKTLVYGGANLGLMECVAKAAKENGGFVMGVVPTKLEERGAVSDLLDVTFRVKVKLWSTALLVVPCLPLSPLLPVAENFRRRMWTRFRRSSTNIGRSKNEYVGDDLF